MASIIAQQTAIAGYVAGSHRAEGAPGRSGKAATVKKQLAIDSSHRQHRLFATAVRVCNFSRGGLPTSAEDPAVRVLEAAVTPRDCRNRSLTTLTIRSILLDAGSRLAATSPPAPPAPASWPCPLLPAPTTSLAPPPPSTSTALSPATTASTLSTSVRSADRSSLRARVAARPASGRRYPRPLVAREPIENATAPLLLRTSAEDACEEDRAWD